jgi:branched-chain amino acid aminotransferase
MGAIVNVNGTLSDAQHATVSVFDHGFLYGEGIYETMRTFNGQPFLFDRHMRRLRASAGMMLLPIPLADGEFERRSRETMRAAGLGEGPSREAYLRILVTRGIGELSYDPTACPAPTVVIIAKPHVEPPAEVYERGVKLSIVSVVRNHPDTVNPLIKSNNLLNNALAMQEAFRRGAVEGVMRNYRGELAECTQSNLFVVRDGAAVTPPSSAGLLQGITREFVFEIGREIGVPVHETALRDDDLFAADEAFFTSSTRGIVPAVAVDDRTIGTGAPGPVTRALREAYERRADALTRAEVRSW